MIEARGHDGREWKRMRVVGTEVDAFDAVLLGFMHYNPRFTTDARRGERVGGTTAACTFHAADRGVTWRLLPNECALEVVSRVSARAAVSALAALGLPEVFADFFEGSA